jgi:hypothetical protein
MCLLYRLLCGVVRVLARGGGERDLEIVVLRHQLAILRRGGKRPQYTTVDRALLAAVSRLLPPERWSCFAVSPQTLRRWHRALLAGGRRRCRRRPGRPPLAAETRGLIGRLARENPRWGYMLIEGELLKLGIGVSATTIATVLRSSGLGPAPRRIGPSWSEFLRAQAHSLVGGGLSSALGDDCIEADAPEPGGPAQDEEARQVEADENRSLAAAAEPRLLARCERGDARPGRLSSRRLERRCARRHRIDRTLATDPQTRGSQRSPHNQALKRDVKATADRGRPRRPRAASPFVRPWHLVTPGVAATERPHGPSARTEFSLPHTVLHRLRRVQRPNGARVRSWSSARRWGSSVPGTHSPRARRTVDRRVRPARGATATSDPSNLLAVAAEPSGASPAQSLRQCARTSATSRFPFSRRPTLTCVISSGLWSRHRRATRVGGNRERGLSHAGEPICLVEPTVDGADDVFPGWDPVWEECLQQCVSISGRASASASIV